MKKAVAALMALVCAVATAAEAGAYDINHCWPEWDPDTDSIYYHDIVTDEIVAVEYPDGIITDYYPEYDTEEVQVTEPTEEEVPPAEITDPWAWVVDQPTEEPYEDTTEDEPYIETEEVEFADPYIADIKARDTSINITATFTKKLTFDSWALYHSDWWYDDQLVAEGTDKYDYSAEEWGINITDTGLIPGETYDYRLVLYKNGEWGTYEYAEAEFSATTELPLYETKMLTPEAHQNSLSLEAVIDSRKEADGFIVEQYKGGKWVTVEKNGRLGYYYNYSDDSEYTRNYDLKSAEYTAIELKSMTKYKYRIRFFRKVGKNKRKYIDTVTVSATTLMAAPNLNLGATSKKAKLSWDKVKGAEGYEVFVKVSDGSYDYSNNWGWYSEDYLDYGTSWFNISDYKKYKTLKGAKNTSASYDIKGNKVYTYCVRAYKGSGSKKVYSEYSQAVATNSNVAILNGLTLKPKSTGLGEYDLGLVKSAVKQCVNDNMSNAEKAVAVYNYVHNVAQYEYDISKVSLDSIKAILVDHAGQCYQYAVTYQAMMKYLGFDMKLIGGKTASGGPHWWNEMVINGTPRMFDPQVGGRFCILYEQLGSRMVTKEKTVD